MSPAASTYHSPAIDFTDGNLCFARGPWPVIVKWASCYGIELSLDASSVPSVARRPETVKRITLN